MFNKALPSTLRPAALCAALLLGFLAHANADEQPATPAPAAATPAPADGAAAPAADQPAEINIKKVFAGNCSWCHGNYGMAAGHGPQLSGTKLTEKEVRNRIMNGQPGMMPSFKKVLKPVEVEALVKYIKGLPGTFESAPN